MGVLLLFKTLAAAAASELAKKPATKYLCSNTRFDAMKNGFIIRIGIAFKTVETRLI
jgi:hypothetical protein